MKLIISILVLVLLSLSCSIDMEHDVVTGKDIYRNSRGLCRYHTTIVSIPLIAPCDYYDVGDSLNKWYRIAMKYREQDSIRQCSK